MYITSEQIQNANKVMLENTLSLAATQFGMIEKWTKLNASTAKAILDDSVSNARALLGAKDPQEYIALQNTLVGPALEKVVAYSKGVYAVATEAQGELSKVAEKQVATWNESVTSVLEQVAKNAPSGADFGLTAVKSFVAATSSAYGNANQAARQTAEATNAVIAEAANATKNVATRGTKS